MCQPFENLNIVEYSTQIGIFFHHLDNIWIKFKIMAIIEY